MVAQYFKSFVKGLPRLRNNISLCISERNLHVASFKSWPSLRLPMDYYALLGIACEGYSTCHNLMAYQ